MHPELFRIFGFPIHSYGLMMVIGFFGAMRLAKFLSRRYELDPELFVNAALIALVTGVLGARASDVLENIHTYLRHDRSAWGNFLAMINLPNGGLTYYGGFLLAFPTLVGYAIWKKIPLRLGMDIIAPCLMVGLGFGRIGCYLNGCCYGADCNLPWAVQFPYGSDAYLNQYSEGKVPKPSDELLQPVNPLFGSGQRLIAASDVRQDPHLKQLAAMYRANPVHPAQLYSSATAFLLAALLLAFLTLPHAPGRAFALMCILEGISRFLLEMVRVEPPVNPALFGPMSLSMVLGIGVSGVGVVLWFVFGRGAAPVDGRGLPVAMAAA